MSRVVNVALLLQGVIARSLENLHRFNLDQSLM
jgi:hypothetical protein